MFPVEVIAALLDSNTLMVETMTGDDAGPTFIEHFTLPKQQTLSEVLSKETYDRLERAIAKTSVSLDRIDRLKPLAVVLLWVELVSTQKTKEKTLSNDMRLDDSLQYVAKRLGKNVVALETYAEQGQVFEDVSQAAQIVLLEHLLDEIEYKRPPLLSLNLASDFFGNNMTHWDELQSRSGVEEHELWRVLNLARNKEMVTKILSKLRANESVLVAVGAAHLPGDDGLIELLRRAGVALVHVNN